MIVIRALHRVDYWLWQHFGEIWPVRALWRIEEWLFKLPENITLTIVWRLPRSWVYWSVIRASTENMHELHGNGSDTCANILQVWAKGKPPRG